MYQGETVYDQWGDIVEPRDDDAWSAALCITTSSVITFLIIVSYDLITVIEEIQIYCNYHPPKEFSLFVCWT